MEEETDGDKGYREKRARTIVIPTKLSALSWYGVIERCIKLQLKSSRETLFEKSIETTDFHLETKWKSFDNFSIERLFIYLFISFFALDTTTERSLRFRVNKRYGARA